MPFLNLFCRSVQLSRDPVRICATACLNACMSAVICSNKNVLKYERGAYLAHCEAADAGPSVGEEYARRHGEEERGG